MAYLKVFKADLNASISAISLKLSSNFLKLAHPDEYALHVLRDSEQLIVFINSFFILLGA